MRESIVGATVDPKGSLGRRDQTGKVKNGRRTWIESASHRVGSPEPDSRSKKQREGIRHVEEDGAVEDLGFRFDRCYKEVVRLVDGTKATLRLIRASDKALLLAGFERLSSGSRYARFLGVKSRLTDDELRYLTEVDGTDHFAVVAVLKSMLGHEEGVGIARFVRLKDRVDAAEPAITVVDEQQGKGLGSALLHRLVDAAWERDVRYFRCEVLAENTRVWELFPEIGPDVTMQPGDDGTVIVTFPLPPPKPKEHQDRGPAVRRVLSYVARELVFFVPRRTGRPRIPNPESE